MLFERAMLTRTINTYGDFKLKKKYFTYEIVSAFPARPPEKGTMPVFFFKALGGCKWPFVGVQEKHIGHAVRFFKGNKWHSDYSAIAGTWKPITLMAFSTYFFPSRGMLELIPASSDEGGVTLDKLHMRS